MDVLKDRFGDEDKLKKHYLAEVKAIGNTRMSETSALPQWQKLHDGLTNTVAALVSLGVNTKTDEAYLTPDLLASYPEALTKQEKATYREASGCPQEEDRVKHDQDGPPDDTDDLAYNLEPNPVLNEGRPCDSCVFFNPQKCKIPPAWYWVTPKDDPTIFICIQLHVKTKANTLLDYFHENEILVLQFVRVIRDFDEAQIFPGVTKKKFKLANFSKNLDSEAKCRLLEQLSLLQIDDPNWIDEDLWKKHRDALTVIPPVTWPKLIDYFQNWRSLITGEKLYVEKDVISAMEQSLEKKWFRDFSTLQLTSNTVVIKAKVTASQTLSVIYYPWVACGKDGMVQFAHCTCTAGLGEMCTHLATLLHALISAHDVNTNRSYTEQKCGWIENFSKPVEEKLAIGNLTASPYFINLEKPMLFNTIIHVLFSIIKFYSSLITGIQNCDSEQVVASL
ncbi:Uncharacterized protein APZ42_025316 [Daphnia magna]|uniref:SWIM-type domain-containing protein n=1 Tax=Daphnia magna TaxID=35525 RepID=A0A164T8G3_9CRUS|nr:Uncharacterized protein APZ42_025316 [Daphnia magna]